MKKTINENHESLNDEMSRFIWEFFDKARGNEEAAVVGGLLPWFFYSAYVSQNIELLRITDFDEAYSLREAQGVIGNSYTPSDYLRYFAELYQTNPQLPKLAFDSSMNRVTLKLIRAWFAVLGSFNLRDNKDFSVAHTIRSMQHSASQYDSYGKRTGTYASNESIAEVMTSLAPMKNQVVVDFMCGDATALSLALEKCAKEVYGMDINESSANRAKIACFFANPQSLSEIKVGDALESAPLCENGSDVVFVAPPFAERIKSDFVQDEFARMWKELFEEEAPKVRTVEEYCFIKTLCELNDVGLGILHTSTGFLYRSSKSETAIRNALVRNGHIQAVIELPAGLSYGTSIKTVLFVIGKKRLYEDILLVDMDSSAIAEMGYCVRARGRKSAQITTKGIEWLKETVKHRQEIPLVSQKITAEEYFNGGSVLSYARYGEVVDIAGAFNTVREISLIRNEIEETSNKVKSVSGSIDKVIEKLGKR